MSKEGWTWLHNSGKWHYFKNGKSLCGKYMILSNDSLKLGNDNSLDNCVKCKKILKESNK